MSELISGKDALIALANGEGVECKNNVTGMDWSDATGLLVSSFFNATNTWEFRIKPRTITINGIEVPATFNPKEGEVFYYINDYSEDGYDWANSCSNLFNNTVWIGKWRSEDEIKQVMAALRKVFNTK